MGALLEVPLASAPHIIGLATSFILCPLVVLHRRIDLLRDNGNKMGTVFNAVAPDAGLVSVMRFAS